MTVEERLEELERELAGLRAELAERVVSREFVVVDNNGKTRATLTRTQDRTALRLHDPNGKGVALSVGKEEALLGLQDENGKTTVCLGVGKDAVWLTLHDEKGESRATLGVTKGGPLLRLFDKKGKTSVALTEDKTGPGLALSDEKGKVIWSAP